MYIKKLLGAALLCFVFCFNVIKIVTVSKELFFYKIFALTCLMMAQIQAKTCSTHENAQSESH
jgi:hypothetical protein